MHSTKDVMLLKKSSILRHTSECRCSILSSGQGRTCFWPRSAESTAPLGMLPVEGQGERLSGAISRSTETTMRLLTPSDSHLCITINDVPALSSRTTKCHTLQISTKIALPEAVMMTLRVRTAQQHTIDNISSCMQIYAKCTTHDDCC